MSALSESASASTRRVGDGSPEEKPGAFIPGNASNPVDSTPQAKKTEEILNPSDKEVLDYLRKKGMGSAALELSRILKEDKEMRSPNDVSSSKPSSSETPGDQASKLKDQFEEEENMARNQKSILSRTTGGSYGYDRDSAASVFQWGVPDTRHKPMSAGKKADSELPLASRIGTEEAHEYLDSFTNFQLWILSLPDSDGTVAVNPIREAQELLQNGGGDLSAASLVKAITQSRGKEVLTSRKITSTLYQPPSEKPELFAVSFALLVHTYCELLELGLESTAHVLRDTFQPIYEPLYSTEFRDLYQCNTTEDMMHLNSHNLQHKEALASLKSIRDQMGSFQRKRDELSQSMSAVDNSSSLHVRKLHEYDRAIAELQKECGVQETRATSAFVKMHSLPFLRRARAVRWQLSISTQAYSLLSSFLHSKDNSLLPLTTLLQTKCELHIERRDPLPFTPACVLTEEDSKVESYFSVNGKPLNWASPALTLEGETGKAETLPFPKFHLDESYNDETTASRDKAAVAFNRSLLINGFRRLEALERKREYEVLPKVKAAKLDRYHATARTGNSASPLSPTILTATLCSNDSGPVVQPLVSRSTSKGIPVDSSIWDEPSVGLCCAKICPPDGRRVAVGCDDAAIRIWNLAEGEPSRREPIHILLGHKNGFPIFDLDWNRDGRSLLSAGGDGSVRLWDSMVVGPYGEVTSVSSSTAANKRSSQKSTQTENQEDMSVPDIQEESQTTTGAALAVYRGHAPSTPIWSVSFAPSGYYFASSGGDGTARLWTTDRTTPVRLFVGHTTMSVNNVGWHPNCNYIITGGEDKTARLWDVHSGATVRLLNGSAGIQVVKISPDGRYAAGGSTAGIVHLWDLGTGKMVTELRTPRVAAPGTSGTSQRELDKIISSLSFSVCGTALAVADDSCCVRVWDIQRDSISSRPVLQSPTRTFQTKQTMVMDLNYNKRNLVLSVGKYIRPVLLPVSHGE